MRASAKVVWGLALALASVSACARNPTRRCAQDGECVVGDACYRGFCIGATRSPDAGARDAARCPFGQTLCGADCVNLLTDREHCGTCDIRCRGGGLDTCSFGHCV